MARPIRFCHVATFYPPYSFGGDGVQIHRLVNALAEQGHEVDVVHCADSYISLAGHAPEQSAASHPRVTVHKLKSRAGILSPLLTQQTGGTWFKTRRLREILLSKKFDVIHYHNISLLGPKVLALQPDYEGFLKVYTTHEHWLICPMHVLWKNNERLCEKPSCFRCTLAFGRPPQWWRYTKRLARCAASVDLFLSPSRFTRQIHGERGFSRPLHHLPHFVPRAELSAQQEAPPHPRPYFLFVGRLEMIKGVQTLLPTFRSYPEADLLIAGTGEFEAELRRRAVGMGNVKFLGRLAQPELAAYYRHAVAAIVPSLCYETFGIVILEAYRLHTPVIVRALGALQEVVEESQGGFAYRTDDDLRDALDRLRTNEGLRREMGERGHRCYLEKWSEQAHVDSYLQLLREAAHEKFGQVPWERLGRANLAFRAGTEQA